MYNCEDNFLPNTHHTEVVEKISDEHFPWYRNTSSPHFSHKFYEDGKPVSAHISAFTNLRLRLFTHKNYKNIKDAAVFFFLQSHEPFEVLRREIFSSKNLTFFTYHLHSSDGNTVIVPNNEYFETKQNRAIFSKANLTIAELSPTKNAFRSVITATLEDI